MADINHRKEGAEGMAEDRKFSEKPVATEQSKAASGKPAGGQPKKAEGRRRTPGRQGPPAQKQPGYRQGLARTPRAGQNAEFMAAAMSEYRENTRGQVETALGVDAVKKANMASAAASIPRNATQAAMAVSMLGGGKGKAAPAGKPAKAATRKNEGAAARVTAMAEEMERRGQDLDLGLDY